MWRLCFPFHFASDELVLLVIRTAFTLQKQWAKNEVSHLSGEESAPFCPGNRSIPRGGVGSAPGVVEEEEGQPARLLGGGEGQHRLSFGCGVGSSQEMHLPGLGVRRRLQPPVLGAEPRAVRLLPLAGLGQAGSGGSVVGRCVQREWWRAGACAFALGGGLIYSALASSPMEEEDRCSLFHAVTYG